MEHSILIKTASYLAGLSFIAPIQSTFLKAEGLTLLKRKSDHVVPSLKAIRQFPRHFHEPAFQAAASVALCDLARPHCGHLCPQITMPQPHNQLSCTNLVSAKGGLYLVGLRPGPVSLWILRWSIPSLHLALSSHSTSVKGRGMTLLYFLYSSYHYLKFSYLYTFFFLILHQHYYLS